MAVAFVVGAAFAALMKDFVTSFIGPLPAVFGGKPEHRDRNTGLTPAPGRWALPLFR